MYFVTEWVMVWSCLVCIVWNDHTLLRFDFSDGKEVYVCVTISRWRLHLWTYRHLALSGLIHLDGPPIWRGGSEGSPKADVCVTFSSGGLPSLEHTNRRLWVRASLNYVIGLVIAQLRMSLLIEFEPSDWVWTCTEKYRI